MRTNPAVDPFSRELTRSHYRVFVNQFHVEGRVEVAFEIFDCGK